MITIYHNPRCSKSRNCLLKLENAKEDITIRNYIKEPLNYEELEQLLKQLDLDAIDLVRKNEAIWKENYKNTTLSNKEVIEILVKYPNLIERPIVLKNNKAVIARPIENLTALLE